MNTAIIVAAGEGKRFGGAVPKQFVEISGKPLIIHTLERFELCPVVDEIIVVLPAAQAATFSEITRNYHLQKLSKTVSGGATRSASVLNGLKVVNSETAEIVAVHDGARPFVSVAEITETIKKAKENGAACLTAPVTDTIKEISDGKIVRTLERSRLRRALTPQCFRYDILRRAFEENNFNAADATDECFLVEKLGVEISIVEGSAKNIKITHKEDFALAEILLKT